MARRRLSLIDFPGVSFRLRSRYVCTLCFTMQPRAAGQGVCRVVLALASIFSRNIFGLCAPGHFRYGVLLMGGVMTQYCCPPGPIWILLVNNTCTRRRGRLESLRLVRTRRAWTQTPRGRFLDFVAGAVWQRLLSFGVFFLPSVTTIVRSKTRRLADGLDGRLRCADRCG